MCQRTSLKYIILFWRKLLRFQRTFLEKSFGPGVLGTAPTDNDHTKKHGNAVRFIFSSLYVGTAVPNIRFRSIACCIFFVLVMVNLNLYIINLCKRQSIFCSWMFFPILPMSTELHCLSFRKQDKLY